MSGATESFLILICKYVLFYSKVAIILTYYTVVQILNIFSYKIILKKPVFIHLNKRTYSDIIQRWRIYYVIICIYTYAIIIDTILYNNNTSMCNVFK